MDDTDPPQTLCDLCADGAGLAEKIVEIFHALADSPRGAQMHLVGASWAQLTHEQRTLLVMTVRGSLEVVSEALYASFTDEAVEATVEIGLITRFIAERCPHERLADESVADVVVRLLEPHVGARIILPGSAVRS